MAKLKITDFLNDSKCWHSIFLLLSSCPKTETQPKTKHPHLSVVTFLKSFTAFTALFFTANRCCLRCISFSEGRILHPLLSSSSILANYFSSRSFFKTLRRRKNRVSAQIDKAPLTLESERGFVVWGSLTMTYFRAGNPHYHRRDFVSRSCSGWEGVVPKRYGRQTVTCVLAGACVSSVVSKPKKEGKRIFWGVIAAMC
jgi:hypothetical protein